MNRWKTSLNRREFLAYTTAAALTGCSSVGKADVSAGQPNFIVIMTDDMGYGDLGCYGSDFIRTPHIDRLAVGGMRFTDYHSNCPVCSPTRAALLTGRYQQRSGIEGVVFTKPPYRERGLPPAEITFAEALKTVGYSTGLIGKWHLGYKEQFNPTQQGFDYFRGFVSGNIDYASHYDNTEVHDWWENLEEVPEDGYLTDLVNQHAVEFIEKNREAPFCLYVAHGSPHSPIQGRQDKPERGPEAVRSGKSADELTATYAEMIGVVDEGVGQILAALRMHDLENSTFVFFCSDNGPAKVGSAGELSGRKGTLWEGGHRVPAIAYWPGRIKAGTITNETAMGMDLFPTMAAVAGVETATLSRFDGVDLRGVLFDEEKLAERSLYWSYNESSCIRRGPWKLLVNARAPGQKINKKRPPKLFNLDDDLRERRDLSKARPDLFEALQKDLESWGGAVRKGVERQS
jgi:arylsulfatase A